MVFEVVHREVLRHNPLNAVTATVERVTDAVGASRVRKELRAPSAPARPGGLWAASSDPRHWNYWRREAEAYSDGGVRRSLDGTGLGMPGCEVVEHEGGVTLWLEDVTGAPGAAFTLDDHVSVATGLGRW
jgi:hypothetical protein